MRELFENLLRFRDIRCDISTVNSQCEYKSVDSFQR